MWPLPWEMFSLHFFLKEYWAWEINLMLFLIERSVMAGCISEIPMRKDSACLLTELQMSNDPSTTEVSPAAQGIKMAQIVTEISENWAGAFYKPVSQACCLWRKGKTFFQSLRFSTFSSDHYSSATPEHQPLQWPFIPTSLSANSASAQVCSTPWPPANWVLSTLSSLQFSLSLFWCCQ